MAVAAAHEIVLPRPMKHQAPILSKDRRFKVLCAGRRWGKTTIGLIACLLGHGPKDRRGMPKFPGALYGANIWWVAPTYKIANPIWRSLKHATRGAWVSKSEVDRRIVLPGGGSITVRSADDPDSLRAAGLDGVVVDEAAMLKDQAWGEALRPALADRQGWAFLITTPKGLNWYHRIWMSAFGRAGWFRWQRPSSDNPILLIPNPETGLTEIEEMRAEMGPLEFAQEVEAQFVTAGAGMFKPDWRRWWRPGSSKPYLPNLGLDALEAIVLERPDQDPKVYEPVSLRRFATVDIAASLKTSADFTVISTWGYSTDGDLALLDCVRARMEGPDLGPALVDCHRRWRLAYIGLEAVGMQLAFVQDAIRRGLPAKELRADGDKVTRAYPATARCAAGRVFLPIDHPDLHDLETEMLSFPIGEHDDFVDTLAYACIEISREDFAPAIAPLGVERVSPWRME